MSVIIMVLACFDAFRIFSSETSQAGLPQHLPHFQFWLASSFFPRCYLRCFKYLINIFLKKTANQIWEAGNDGESKKTSKQDAGLQLTKDVSAKSPLHPEHLDLPWLDLLELEKVEPAHSATPHDFWHISQPTMERPHAHSSKHSGSKFV